MSSLVELPLREGDLMPWVIDQVVSGPVGLQEVQISYEGGNKAYPVQPPPLCRFEKVLPALPEPPTVMVVGAVAAPPQ